jgi:hypothetical protein
LIANAIVGKSLGTNRTVVALFVEASAWALIGISAMNEKIAMTIPAIPTGRIVAPPDRRGV